MRISFDDALGGLSHIIPGDSLHLRKATIVDHPDTGELAVNLDGNIVEASWADGLHAFAGDVVLVTFIKGPRGRGQSEVLVLGRLAEKPRPAGGTVFTVPGGSVPTITVTGSDGYFYEAYYVMSYTPVVGDPVFMSWAGGRACVMGKLKGVFTADPTTNQKIPQPVAAPEDDDTEGEFVYTAESSGTWSTTDSAWDEYRFGGGHVYQSATQNGAWFYHGGPAQLDGYTIEGIEFTLGTRLAVGNHTEPVMVHFYLHTSESKPASTDVTRTLGPYDVLIPGGTTQNTVELPVEWGPDLVAGAGISISGDALAGFTSSSQEPTSGLLKMEWSTEE